MANPLLIAKAPDDIGLLPGMSNRHGLVCGATGTGKTVTIQAMSERFSEIGVPVFVADVKGDVAGLSQPGGGNDRVDQRIAELGLVDYTPRGYPVVFWDIYGDLGHPLRTTISELGPLLLARLMRLNETQTGVLLIVFAYADDHNLPIVDFRDLRALLALVAERRKEILTDYGTVSGQSVGAIQRAVLGMEQEGADRFFGEPALQLTDFLTQTSDGMGTINILAADRLYQSPTAYSTFLLWLLSELFESLPEVGDPEKPKLVFFFDEAHLLFTDTPKSLQEKIEQVIRLIRSKGVGIFFVTQMPIDIPDVVLGQLGNRVQHALRAFTPRDQKAVRAVSETFRTNPELDVETAVTELQVGEALVSFLDDHGAPGVVERALIVPPRSRVGPITESERMAIMSKSPMSGKYDQAVDRETAYELLEREQEQAAAEAALEEKRIEIEKLERQRQSDLERKTTRRKSTAKSPFDDVIDSAANTVGREIGRSVVRGILGSLSKVGR